MVGSRRTRAPRWPSERLRRVTPRGSMKTAPLPCQAVLGAAAAAILLVGCDGTHIVGTLDAGGPPSQDSGPEPEADGGLDGPRTGEIETETWTGYFEHVTFPSGSDTVRLSFTVDSSGRVTGTVTMGEGTPPPPASDPNVGYPPSLAANPPPINSGPSRWTEGYPHTIDDGTLKVFRLKFTISLFDVWSRWCALQTPVPPSRLCIPD